MLDTEKQKLLNRDSDYISIGITPGGIPKGGDKRTLGTYRTCL